MKRSVIPSLDDLRAFETVARHGSMRGAAEELALTHGAVSRRVANLSAALDVRLIQAEGRGIALTPSGTKLAETAQQALKLIAETVTSIKGAPAGQPIVLSCERSVAMRWLIPRLSRFQDLYPDLAIHLSVGGGPLNLVSDGVTLAIRRLDFAVEPHWRVEQLFQEEIGPVMPPEMAPAFCRGDYLGLGTKTRPRAWEQWLSMQPEQPRPREIRLLDHHFLMAEAAAGNLGVAMCPRVLACDDLKSGRLVAPCGFQSDGSSYGLISSGEQELPEPARTLHDWLVAIFREDLSSSPSA